MYEGAENVIYYTVRSVSRNLQSGWHWQANEPVHAIGSSNPDRQMKGDHITHAEKG